MSLYKTDPVTGDWIRENGGFVRVDDAQEVIIHMTTRLRMLRGEVARDTRVGLDHDQIITNPAIDPGIAAGHITSTVLDTPGIVEAEVVFGIVDERGELQVEVDGVFLGTDLRERRIRHERILVRTTGSIG